MFMSLFIAACFAGGITLLAWMALAVLDANWPRIRLWLWFYMLGLTEILAGWLARRFTGLERWAYRTWRATETRQRVLHLTHAEWCDDCATGKGTPIHCQ